MQCLLLKLTDLFMLTSAERSSDFLVEELPMLEFTIQSLYSSHLKILWRVTGNYHRISGRLLVSEIKDYRTSGTSNVTLRFKM